MSYMHFHLSLYSKFKNQPMFLVCTVEQKIETSVVE
jgi:hypothetical protein